MLPLKRDVKKHWTRGQLLATYPCQLPPGQDQLFTEATKEIIIYDEKYAEHWGKQEEICYVEVCIHLSYLRITGNYTAWLGLGGFLTAAEYKKICVLVDLNYFLLSKLIITLSKKGFYNRI